MAIRTRLKTTGLVGSQCQSGGQCGTIKQTGADAGGNAVYGCVTTGACGDGKPYNAGVGYDGQTEYGSIMSSLDAGGWPEGYLNATGNNLPELKQATLDAAARVKSLQTQYDNAAGYRSPWLNDFVAYMSKPTTGNVAQNLARTVSQLKATEMSDDAKAYFAAIGVGGQVSVGNLKSAVDSALSTQQGKINSANASLAAAQKLYNEALAVAGQSDPDTIKAVGDAQATVIAAQSSSSTIKWIVGGGILLVIGGVLFFILRKKK